MSTTPTFTVATRTVSPCREGEKQSKNASDKSTWIASYVITHLHVSYGANDCFLLVLTGISMFITDKSCCRCTTQYCQWLCGLITKVWIINDLESTFWVMGIQLPKYVNKRAQHGIGLLFKNTQYVFLEMFLISYRCTTCYVGLKQVMMYIVISSSCLKDDRSHKSTKSAGNGLVSSFHVVNSCIFLPMHMQKWTALNHQMMIESSDDDSVLFSGIVALGTSPERKVPVLHHARKPTK